MHFLILQFVAFASSPFFAQITSTVSLKITFVGKFLIKCKNVILKSDHFVDVQKKLWLNQK